MGIENYSKTAASNNSAAPNGAPEGMAPGLVNDVLRQVMADIRTWFEDLMWTNLGYTHTYSSGTEVTISGDVTVIYYVGRRVRAVGSTTGTIYGSIATTNHSGGTTTVTFTWDSGSLQNESLTVSLGPAKTGSPLEQAIINNLGTLGALAALDTVGTAEIEDEAVTYAKIQDISATARLLGRKTASSGDLEECTLSEVLDFIGSAAQGDILYRGASAWARLAAGTSGQALITGGAGAIPSWGIPVGSIVDTDFDSLATYTTLTSQIPYDDTVPTDSEGTEILTASVTPSGSGDIIEGVVFVPFTASANGDGIVVTVFQGSSIVAVGEQHVAYLNQYGSSICVPFRFLASSGSSVSLSVRAGPNSSQDGSVYVNGSNSSRIFGGAAKATLNVKVIKQ